MVWKVSRSHDLQWHSSNQKFLRLKISRKAQVEVNWKSREILNVLHWRKPLVWNYCLKFGEKKFSKISQMMIVGQKPGLVKYSILEKKLHWAAENKQQITSAKFTKVSDSFLVKGLQLSVFCGFPVIFAVVVEFFTCGPAFLGDHNKHCDPAGTANTNQWFDLQLSNKNMQFS